MKLFCLLLTAWALQAAPKEFNGRWDIVPAEDARHRVWWLEVTGAGTPKIAGSFVGAPGGQVDPIPDIRITPEQELEFVFHKKYISKSPKDQRAVYRAKVVNGKLVGTLQVEGTDIHREFTGVRAPSIKEHDDGRWRPGTPIELLNGRDLNGWHTQWKAENPGWVMKDGILLNQPPTPDLVTDQKFWNFRLHAEYRYGPESNSGIALRGRYEVQIYDDFGKPASVHGSGALYSRKAPSATSSKAPGEWQTMDITLVGNDLTVVLNGTKVLDKEQLVGLTAMASDPNEADPGPIVLQGDHGKVEFRKLTLTPLTRSGSKSD